MYCTLTIILLQPVRGSMRRRLILCCSLASRMACSLITGTLPGVRSVYGRGLRTACLAGRLAPKSINSVGLPKALQLATSALDDTFLRETPHQLPPGAPFTVLGIETSCDDTGVAIVRSDGNILGEALASQAELHEVWGGVHPSTARDAHAEALDRVVAAALSRAGMSSVAEVDVIAVTVGPGLEICLRVGCDGAKALAIAHDKPFVGVHHLEAHVLMARLGDGDGKAPPVRTLFHHAACNVMQHVM